MAQDQEKAVVQWSRDSTDPDLITAQKNDPIIGRFYQYMEDPEKNAISSKELEKNEELKVLMRNKNQMEIHDGLIVRNSKSGETQWLVPTSFRGIMMEHAHNEITAGHRGAKKTTEILMEVAYWPHMYQDVTIYCRGCLTCAQFQPSTPRHRAPLQKRGVVLPWSDIQIDFVGPVVRSARGYKYILTVTCLFSKWVEAIPARDCKAETTALLLMNHIFARLGLPQKCSSDRGSGYTADVMARVWKILGVKRQLHIAYRPASSGSVERYNQTIVNVLKKFVSETGADWDLKLPLVLMAIRATPSQATGISPFELTYGRRMTTPAHLLYRTQEQVLVTAASVHDYVVELRKHLQYAFAHAQKNLEKAAEGNKTYYDLKTTKSQYEVGDKVYLYNFAKFRAKARKFLPSWTGAYTITEKISPVVYKILIKKGQLETERWVHINQLKACHPQSQLKIIEGETVHPEMSGPDFTMDE